MVRSIVLTIEFSLLASVAIGGLSGTYTVKPDGTGDFLSLSAAGEALTDSGVSGNCLFEVHGDTQPGQCSVGPVAGSDSWTTTFRPGPGANPVLSDGEFNAGSYHNVKIESLRFLRAPITIGSCSGWRIYGCRITTESRAVKLSNSTGDTLDANTVNVVSAGTGYDTAIVVESGSDNAVFNNVVNSESCPAEALVYFSGEQNTRFVFNTLRLSPWRRPMSYGFEAWCERPCDVRNNVFVLVRPAESTNACVGIRPIGDSVVPDYNCYFVESLGYACASPDPFYPYLYTWDEWRGFGFESNGINADPLLVSATDLHLRQGSPCIGTATPITGIDFDIDGDPRDPAHPDIGADEFTGGAVGETQSAEVRTTHASTVVRGVLFQPLGTVPIRGQSPCLLDASGRKMLDLKPGANDVRTLAPGVYFVREARAQVVRKVVVTR